MARITNISTSNYTVTIKFDNGKTLTIDPVNAGVIKQQLLKDELRSAIRNIVDDEISAENIDKTKYDDVRGDFEDELYEDFADEIDCGDYTALCNDGEWIREKVSDLIAYYDIEPDDEEE